MWPRGWLEVQLYSSMTAALEGGEWSAARPGRILPPGKTRYPFHRRLGGTQGRSGRAENLVLAGIRSRTVQPVVSHYSDWATSTQFSEVLSQNYKRLHVKCLLFWADFNGILFSRHIFLKIHKYEILRKIHPLRSELFHADGRTERRTDRLTWRNW